MLESKSSSSGFEAECNSNMIKLSANDQENAKSQIWSVKASVNTTAVEERARQICEINIGDKEYEIAWLVKAISCIDLTTLSADDTDSNVKRLCIKAARPINTDLASLIGFENTPKQSKLTTAAVCVYPSKIPNAVNALKAMSFQHNIHIAAVATGFPSGQYPLKSRLEEIRAAIEMGANEIDIVIDRSLVITGQWETLFEEIRQMKDACGSVHMKAILAVGELDSLLNVYKASWVAMVAGSDFIKTSTGKETSNATIPVGIVMCRAIKDFYQQTGRMVGLKPAGGIRTYKDALNWLKLIKEELGPAWLTPEYFRIGASGLLTDVEKRIHYLVYGKPGIDYEFMIAPKKAKSDQATLRNV